MWCAILWKRTNLLFLNEINDSVSPYGLAGTANEDQQPQSASTLILKNARATFAE